MGINLCQVMLAGVEKSRVEGGFESVLSFLLLPGLEEGKFLEQVKAVFIDAVGIYNDKAAFGALAIIVRFHENLKDRRDDQDEKCFQILQDFFWKMPYVKDGGGICSPAMERSKKYIIQCVMSEWRVKNSHSPKKITFYTRNIFRFVADTYHSVPKPMIGKMTESEKRIFESRTKDVFEKNKKMIEEIVREEVKNCSSDNLKLWMEEPWMPEGLAKILAHAWARNGGWLDLTKKK